MSVAESRDTVLGTPPLRRLVFTVPEEMDGWRVDEALRGRWHLTRRAISHAKFEDDGIMLDGVRIHTNEHVRVGQQLAIIIGDNEEKIDSCSITPQQGSLAIVYEDEDLVIIDKPAGLVMYPGPGHETDTLGSYLLAYFFDSGIQASYHPVQRLDRGTSGLLIVAKNAHTQAGLSRALHTNAYTRTYLALCENVPTPQCGSIEAPIARVGGHPCVYGVAAQGKPALTHYEVLASTGEGATKIAGDARPLSLVRLQLETGRTHQIRLHMAHIGCPVFGDALYGNASERLDHPALHSAHIAFMHPVTGEHLEFEAPLPHDMQMIVDALFDDVATRATSVARAFPTSTATE